MAKRRHRRETEQETLWETVVACNRTSPLIDFGLEQLRNASLERGRTLHLETAPDVTKIDADVRLEIGDQATLDPDGFECQRRGACLHMTACDERGAMYALMELTEHVQMGRRFEQVPPGRHAPTFALRVFAANVPVEYYVGFDPAGPASEKLWSSDAWRDLIDALGRLRFNVLAFVGLNPFTRMLRLHRWPDAHSGTDAQFDTRRQFWRDVLDHCLARGIDPYLVTSTWHVPRGAAAALVGSGPQPGAGDLHGKAGKPSPQLLMEYFGECVRTLLTDFPQVRGVGFLPAAGAAVDHASAEQAFARICADVVSDMQSPPHFIRYVESPDHARSVVEHFAPQMPGRVVLAPTHRQARLLSRPGAVVEEIAQLASCAGDAGLKTVYALRQDDVYGLPWADPEFVRQVVQAARHAGADGLQIAIDPWFSTLESAPAQSDEGGEWDFQRHHSQVFLWGRSAYDSELPDALFVDLHRRRFGDGAGEQLASALQRASQIVPAVNRLLGTADLPWSAESCLTRRGLRTVVDFMDAHPAAGCDTIGISDYIDADPAQVPAQGETPQTIIDLLHDVGTNVMTVVQSLDDVSLADPALHWWLRDLEALACLGRYYAFKIAAAMELARYRLALAPGARVRASQLLAAAGGWWNRLADNTRGRYKTSRINSLGLPFGWWLYTQDVERDALSAEHFDPDAG
ncbi:MAG TPA: hypothetical protein VMZ31_20135 [Phycisphaerae bacterium]|nr:hypothetical protein [Phycisphaerae bacterium]